MALEFHKYITRCYFGYLQHEEWLRSSKCPLPLRMWRYLEDKKNKPNLFVNLSPTHSLLLTQMSSKGVVFFPRVYVDPGMQFLQIDRALLLPELEPYPSSATELQAVSSPSVNSS